MKFHIMNLTPPSSMLRHSFTVKSLLVLSTVALLCACSNLPKKPWVQSYQRSLLEDKLMQPSRHATIKQFRQFTNRSSGARSSGVSTGGEYY
ncbi:MAG: hypothetical protein JKY67_17790 [Pseudomonadales bacterium]|nr:hypothetical protein [Pseudomonadales bacterium]